MGFAAPWFLAGLLAVGVPIWVHLLRQHKATPRPFSSLMFFERREITSSRHLRLQHLALLAMRVLLIVLLALLFANLHVSCSPGAAAGRNSLRVLALDRSFSMKAGDRMQRAQAAAERALGSGRVQVIAFDSQTANLTRATRDAAAARAAIRSVEAGDGRSTYAELARTLRAIAAAENGPIEAHVFSDMQASSLPSPFSELVLPPNVSLRLHRIAEGAEQNAYVANVVAPSKVFGTAPVRVQAVVAGAPGETSVSLTLNGGPGQTKRVVVPTTGRAGVEFEIAGLGYGVQRGAVQLDARDVLPQDNSFPFAIERREAAQVRFTGDSRSALYLRTALEADPAAGFAFSTAATPAAAAIIAGSPAAAADVETWVRRGGGLLIALGPENAANGRVPVTGQKVLDSRYASRGDQRYFTVASADTTHPALADGGFEGVRVFQAVRIVPGEARVLAKLNDGTPLLLEQAVGEGRVLVLTTALDNIGSDLPVQPAFVPFVSRTLRYLARVEDGGGDYAVGSHLELRTSRETGSGVEVIGPAGERVLSLSEAAKATTVRLDSEGFYEVRRASGRNQTVAAHVDRRESDLAPISEETLALWQNTGRGNSGAPAATGDPAEGRQSLWRYFAAALLVLALAESVFANRVRARAQTPALARKAAA